MSRSRYSVKRARPFDLRRKIADALAARDAELGAVEARFAPDGPLSHGAFVLSIEDEHARVGRGRRRSQETRTKDRVARRLLRIVSGRMSITI